MLSNKYLYENYICVIIYLYEHIMNICLTQFFYLKCLIEKLAINNDRLTINNEKLTIVIENQEKIIKKLNEAVDKSDLKTFAEITKTNFNNTLQKNLSTTIHKTLNEKT